MQFDRAYYRRFYLDPRTAIRTRGQTAACAKMIAACVRYLDIPVRSILDAGCGIGSFRRPLLREFKGADYAGIEVSAYLCERYGWQRGSIDELRTRRRFDLIICNDVLQYLDAASSRRAIANLARLCRGALYFGALTREDWEENCEQSGTDRTPWLRSGKWYRRELQRAFVGLGPVLKLQGGQQGRLRCRSKKRVASRSEI